MKNHPSSRMMIGYSDGFSFPAFLQKPLGTHKGVEGRRRKGEKTV
jgi:hypothetical protein